MRMLKHKRKRQIKERSSKKQKTENSSSEFCLPTETSEESNKDSLEKAQSDYNITNNHYNIQSDDLDHDEGALIVDHETQESEGGEAGLKKYLASCEKNPGHKQFIPIDKFKLKHLPESYQDNDLYEYIKALADLTVKLNVKMTSLDRPKFWSKTTHPYPFSKMSDRRNLRTGSGRVRYVNKFKDGVTHNLIIGSSDFSKCWCRKCQVSDSPSNVWWEFYVFTATHVVFDDIEASHATLRLFYDRDDSPVVSVNNVSIDYRDIDGDWCVLKCVTCDKYIGNKLMGMWRHNRNVWMKIFNKYRNYTSKNKLNIIVSHPHGSSKQVSVGQWKDKHKMGEDRSKFTYTTCTCPGSSGAHVLCLGYSDWWLYDLVHTGSLKSGLNYSGVGDVY
ncbi:hypothetical protein BgiMline_022204 [Biomphalaria glabrata]|uniref:Uncharacterized protein LOC106079761 isoform X1 n=2 Tax=Biomphalaria glabrata TaxID=6526 RepID=A0A9U8EP73_BIOGL|nr:uncharacterized protein LOC106079761 isoform X1 [Biomphalaria glabrata]XP_055893492.1 uncharacterized protein LOC106079761 isoform X1 [Biomphalaria glabrata]KAI8756571.1 hypothetical protein BgiMline_010086 [Biomphalaria glabrata]